MLPSLMARATIWTIPSPPISPLSRSLADSGTVTTLCGREQHGWWVMDTDNVLDPRQEKYLQWLCLPAQLREPSSKEKYAKENSVDVTTLRRWEKKPAFKAEWEKRVNDLQGSPERTQRILDSLYEAALGGDNKAAQLYLQATNRFAPTQIKVEHKQTLAELSDEELDALIMSEAKAVRLERSSKEPNDL